MVTAPRDPLSDKPQSRGRTHMDFWPDTSASDAESAAVDVESIQPASAHQQGEQRVRADVQLDGPATAAPRGGEQSAAAVVQSDDSTPRPKLGKQSAQRRREQVAARWEGVPKPLWTEGLQVEARFLTVENSGEAGSVILRDEVGTELRRWRFPDALRAVACDPVGGSFIVAGNRRIWHPRLDSTNDSTDIGTPIEVDMAINVLAWDPGMDFFVAGGDLGFVATPDVIERPEGPFDATPSPPVRALAVSPFEFRVVAATDNGLFPFSEEGRYTAVTAHPRGAAIAGLPSGRLELVEPSGQFRNLASPHDAEVTWVGTSRSGLLASLDADGRAIVVDWNGADPASLDPEVPLPAIALPSNRRWLRCAWHPDRDVLLAVDEGGQAAFFDVAGTKRTPWFGVGDAVVGLAVQPGYDAETGQRGTFAIGDVATDRDMLGFQDDARAIAHLVASVDTVVPLSMAVLGEWGSGKSSLLRMVDATLAQLTDQPSSTYVSPITRVWFNAWHYSDDQVWTGLVEQMFRELAPMERTELMKPAEVSETESKIADYEALLKRTSDEIERIDERALRDAVVTPLDVPRSVVTRFVDTVGDTFAELWRRHRVLIVLAAVLVIGLLIAAPIIGDTGGMVMASAPVAGAVMAGTWAWSRGASVWQQAKSLAETAKRTADQLREKDAERRKALSEQRKETEAALETLRVRLESRSLQGQFEELLKQLGDEKRFEAYRGLAGRVHRDLENYARLLKQLLSELARNPAEGGANANASDGGRKPPQRIVLFIDDLDRCRSDRVVEVLQAVNLLTTTGLFVVIAAIEPGWVMKSLSSQHAQQITGSGGRDARALQFLDKLFPLALTVRPMGDQAKSFLRGLLTAGQSGAASDGSKDSHDQSGFSGTGEKSTPGSDRPRDGVDRESETPNRDPSSEIGSSGPVQAATEATAEQVRRAAASVNATAVLEAIRAARLSEAEIQFLPELTPLLPGPRAAKRFANLYRLLHASLGSAERRGFRTDPDAFKPTAILLAAVVGAPDQAERLLALLTTAPTGSAPNTVDQLFATRRGITVVARLTGLLETLDAPRDLDRWSEAAHRVARYSVATYHRFSAGPSRQ